MKNLSTLILLLTIIQTTFSQVVEALSPPEYIKTVYFVQNDSVLNGVPILKKGESFTVKFDDIIGDEAFYYYKISHYNFDWTPSSLNKNNYMQGFDNIRITNVLNSLNSLQIYTHYEVTIPNQNTQALTETGNYMFEVYDENEALLFAKKFIVYSNNATVEAQIKRSRDLKYAREKQVVQFQIEPNDLIINPAKNLKILVLQNNNLNTAITNLTPQFTIGNKYIFKYDQEASFWGSNEYWNLDNKDLRTANASVAKIELKEIYNHYLFMHPYRALRPYTYNPDINGGFVVRNIDASNSDIEAEYVWVHFRLNVQEINNKEIHIYGNFNDYVVDESTKLTFDSNIMAYTGKLLLKQGFYNFKYVTTDKKGNINEGEISGNFDTTENEYTVLVYYKSPSDLCERVIGLGKASSTNIIN